MWPTLPQAPRDAVVALVRALALEREPAAPSVTPDGSRAHSIPRTPFGRSLGRQAVPCEPEGCVGDPNGGRCDAGTGPGRPDAPASGDGPKPEGGAS